MDTRKVATEYRMARWAQILQDRKLSGEMVKDYCRTRGISKDSYFYWQKKLREAACEQLTVMQPGSANASLIGAGFTEVRLMDSPPLNLSTENKQSGQLTIEASGVKIEADAAYPASQLAYLLRELVSTC